MPDSHDPAPQPDDASRSGQTGRSGPPPRIVAIEEQRQHEGPLWAGIALACLSPLVSVPIVQSFSSDAYSRPGVLLGIVLGVPVAVLMTGVLGVPYFLILRALGVLSWVSLCLGTTVAGAALFHLLHLGFAQDPSAAPDPSSYGAVSGLIAGVAFCIGSWPVGLFMPSRFRRPNW